VQAISLSNAGPDRVGLVSATTNVARQAGLALGPAIATLPGDSATIELAG
jgi:hypothetical protein